MANLHTQILNSQISETYHNINQISMFYHKCNTLNNYF